MRRNAARATLAALIGLVILVFTVRPEIVGIDTVARRRRTAVRMDELVAQVKRTGHDSAALARLVAATTSSYAFERSHALSSLGTVDDLPESAVIAMAAQLKNTDSQTRNSAALALANMGADAEPAIHELIYTLKTYSSDGAGTWAAEALGNIGVASDKVLEALKHAAEQSDNTSTARRARQSYDRLMARER